MNAYGAAPTDTPKQTPRILRDQISHVHNTPTFYVSIPSGHELGEEIVPC